NHDRAAATARGPCRTGPDAMPSAFPRPGKPSTPLALLALAVTTCLAVSLYPVRLTAEASEPARKDSSPRTRPKDVVVTASVSPSEARAGETVHYKVTARLNPGWHIYTYAREANDVGPRKTLFDLFETGGLTVAGGWTASKEATNKKEPAFPELESVSFYEDE